MYEPKHYCVMDIERNFRPYQSKEPTEIIDIAVIKIEASTMKILDVFSSFVNPTAPISRHTTKLTGITRKDVAHAKRFPQVIKQFESFIGEESMLVTWGKEDYSFLQADCKQHNLSCAVIPKEKRFNLQQFVFHAYTELFPHQPNLKFAVEQLELEWEGEAHRALDDAINTANLFLTVAKQKDIQQSYKASVELFLVQNGALTHKGRKKLKRWIFKELKKSGQSDMTWETFIKSRTWENVTEQYHVDELTLLLLHRYFGTALRKVKQQIKILEAKNDSKLL
ncbi:exonuclease [Bacillus sp. 165]|uniref:exonuclease n=1 Tax=Bacillus sp. 165 TaxID=1529117 RepID=UPI001ADBCDC1|nr:exonuclease [Bacillus sp. 165]MBO9129242.1 exonuclease [Bacillus sp. 165]